MVTLDEQAIRRIRLKARGLRHDPKLSKRKISRIIADEFGLPFNTVRYYAFIIGRDWKKQDKRYKKIDNKNYDLKYKQLTRHIDSILPQVFKNNLELPLKQISTGIDQLAGVYIKERTLEKLLLKYEGNPRGPPVVKSEAGNYRLNDLFYESSNLSK